MPNPWPPLGCVVAHERRRRPSGGAHGGDGGSPIPCAPLDTARAEPRSPLSFLRQTAKVRELKNIVKDPCTRTVKTRQARSVGQWRVASGDVVRRDGASGWQCRCHAPLLGACDTQHDSPGDPTDLVLATTSPPEVQNARRGDRSPKWHGGVAVERGDHCLQWDTEAASCSPSWWALNPRCNNRAPTGVRNRGLCGARRPPRRKGTADGRERPTGRHVWPAGSNTTIREVTSARGGCDRPSCSTSVRDHKS